MENNLDLKNGKDTKRDIFDKITVGDSFVETYIINNFDKVNAFFVGLWEFIKAGVVAATVKL